MIGPASLRGRLLLCMGLGLSVLWLVLAVWPDDSSTGVAAATASP